MTARALVVRGNMAPATAMAFSQSEAFPRITRIHGFGFLQEEVDTGLYRRVSIVTSDFMRIGIHMDNGLELEACGGSRESDWSVSMLTPDEVMTATPEDDPLLFECIQGLIERILAQEDRILREVMLRRAFRAEFQRTLEKLLLQLGGMPAEESPAASVVVSKRKKRRKACMRRGMKLAGGSSTIEKLLEDVRRGKKPPRMLVGLPMADLGADDYYENDYYEEPDDDDDVVECLDGLIYADMP